MRHGHLVERGASSGRIRRVGTRVPSRTVIPSSIERYNAPEKEILPHGFGRC